jgi:hypothetical protein
VLSVNKFGPDFLPKLRFRLEIVAIDLSVLGSIVLFACPNCGLTKAETAMSGLEPLGRPLHTTGLEIF